MNLAAGKWWVEIGEEDTEGEFVEIAMLDAAHGEFAERYGLTFSERSIDSPVPRSYAAVEIESGRQFLFSHDHSYPHDPVWLLAWSDADFDRQRQELADAMSFDMTDYRWVRRGADWVNGRTGNVLFPPPPPQLASRFRLLVRLTIREAGAGGRSGPVATGYRPNCWFGLHREGERLYHDLVFYLRSDGDTYERAGGLWIAPGGVCTAEAFPMYPSYLRDVVRPSLRFEVCEGHRVVADASVLEVRDPGPEFDE